MFRRSNRSIPVVSADQPRGASLVHAGQEPVITPDLDRFASEGRRLTRAVANCPLSSPVRASMITGLHPLIHGVIGNGCEWRPKGGDVQDDA